MPDAMADHERGRVVSSSRRKVGDALEEWLTRIEHSIKPSMAQNWRNYAAYYVVPYIGQREVQDITGAVCDALYAKLLAEGRVKARPKQRTTTQAVHVRRLAPDGRALPCRPYGYDTVRCYHTHAEGDPALGRPIEPRKLGRRAAEDAAETARRKLNPGLEPKTVVNTHRMLHRAWEDFATWGWAKRNVVSDAHPPRVPRKGRKVWTVAQLQTFLQRARSDRFFALWVLEATSGMRRCELAGARRDLLDLDAGNAHDRGHAGRRGRQGDRVGRQDRERSARPGARPVHAGRAEGARREARPGAARVRAGLPGSRRAVLLGGRQATPPRHDHPAVQELAAAAGLPEIDLHDVRHSYATAGRDAKIDWKALSQRIGHADVAFTMKQYVQTDLEADRQVANTLAELIIGGSLASIEIATRPGARAKAAA